MDLAAMDHHRELIEQVRRVNKVLSLYVLGLQDSAELSADDHNGIVRALRDLIETIDADLTSACSPVPR